VGGTAVGGLVANRSVGAPVVGLSVGVGAEVRFLVGISLVAVAVALG